MSAFFHPKLEGVQVLQPYRLHTRWSTGETLEVDLQPMLRKHPALAQLLDPKVFAKARIDASGHGIEWLDAEMGADNVYAWAKEQSGEVSHQIPRPIWLACLGWEATKPKAKMLPRALPTAREYALTHR